MVDVNLSSSSVMHVDVCPQEFLRAFKYFRFLSKMINHANIRAGYQQNAGHTRSVAPRRRCGGARRRTLSPTADLCAASWRPMLNFSLWQWRGLLPATPTTSAVSALPMASPALLSTMLDCPWRALMVHYKTYHRGMVTRFTNLP